MSSPNHTCPVCGGASYEIGSLFGSKKREFPCREGTSVCQKGHELAITRAKRIAHLEAALTRIKTLADAPDPDPSGDRQLGLHCGLEDRGAQGDPHDACDYGYSEGVGRTMEWAVNEAEAGLKEKP